MKIRILLADDHQLFREGLRALIEAQDDMTVVGEAPDGRECSRLAHVLVPTLVLMDVMMPELNGMEATRILRAELPDVRILALSMHSERNLVVQMLKAGASGYVLKESSFAELARGIRAVADGRIYISPAPADALISEYIAMADGDKASAFSLLTDREIETLQCLTEGKTTKEIASELALSVKTVETHRQSIMEKLNIHSVAGLTKYAIREGITPA
jgi:two-component system, NarL family, response regulator NreC